MYRNVITELVSWYEEKRRRILFIKGAHGVGKTWTIKDFATAFFPSQKYIDCAQYPAFASIISGIKQDTENSTSEENTDADDQEDSILLSQEDLEDMSVGARVMDMDFLLEEHFENAKLNDSLLIFDNVQDIPECASFFYEFSKSHKDYNICLIASSMEITEYEYSHQDVFNIIRMRPMTFEEYMIANKAHPFMNAIQNNKDKPLTSLEVNAISVMLKEYLLIGGMPGAVSAFLKNKDFNDVRPVQLALLEDYRVIIKDKFAQAFGQRCKRIWKSIPKQLTKDNKKFMYRFVDSNARSREYSEATQALCNLGIARKLPRLEKGVMPLEDYVDYKAFELFYIDHGLLRAAYGLPMREDLTIEEIFAEENGAIAEQFLFQELSYKVGNLYYWTSGATARVPFIYEGENGPIPVDIRFISNKKAQNIKSFLAKTPDTELTLKISLDQVSMDGKVLNIPAYGLWNM